MLRAEINKTWRNHVTNKCVYGNIPKDITSIREHDSDIADSLGAVKMNFSVMLISRNQPIEEQYLADHQHPTSHNL